MTTDPVQHAFDLLRATELPTTPDPALEARLRERFQGKRSGLRSWLRSLSVPTFVVVAAGVAGAAGGGLDWVRTWWYRVDVSGVSATDVVGGDGERTLHFESSLGGPGRVRLESGQLEDGRVRNRIDIERAGPAGSTIEEHEAAEEIFGTAPAPAVRPLSLLEDATHLTSGFDQAGEAYELYALEDESRATILLAHRPECAEGAGTAGDELVEVARFAKPLLTLGGGHAEVENQPDGTVEVRFRYDRGSEMTFVWNPRRAPQRVPASGVSELSTPDGEVRVRLETQGSNQ